MVSCKGFAISHILLNSSLSKNQFMAIVEGVANCCILLSFLCFLSIFMALDKGVFCGHILLFFHFPFLCFSFSSLLLSYLSPILLFSKITYGNLVGDPELPYSSFLSKNDLRQFWKGARAVIFFFSISKNDLWQFWRGSRAAIFFFFFFFLQNDVMQ